MSAVSNLVYWVDPIQSGVVFGSVLVIALSLHCYSLITVLAYTGLAILAAILGAKLYTFVMIKAGKVDAGSDPLKCVSTMTLSVPEEIISNHAPCVAGSINLVLNKGRSLFLLDNPIETTKFCMVLYMLTYIGAWFNALTIVILAWAGAFTLPKLYINNKAQCDEIMGKVKVQLDQIIAKVTDVLPAFMKPSEEVTKKEE